MGEWPIGGSLVVALAALVGLTSPLGAQQDRLVMLRGTVHPKASPGNDARLEDPLRQLGYVSLLLKKTAAQQIALERLLEEQQDSSSAEYHRWLTPEEYADRFGASPSDVAKIVAWLQVKGLTVEATARGRDWIAFSGTVSQVQTAFQTEFHRYRVDGEEHFANAREPSLPKVLADLIEDVRGFNDFLPRHIGGHSKPVPEFTGGSGHMMAPDDLAAIYNVIPLYRGGFDGTGERLAVVGQSAILVSDIQLFRNDFGLPPKDPEIRVFGPDPGITSDQMEANLDVEWSGAVARNATIVYEYSKNAFDAVQDVIDNQRAPVLSMSFGGCEAGQPATTEQALAQKGNSEGITWLAASFDSGPASCDEPEALAATLGLSASFPATIPEVTAVGGTEFEEGAGTFWSATNSLTLGSALGYIPEAAWNESGPTGIWSSGGGPSKLFAKPSWQTGPGVPNDGLRDVPDIALTAAAHDGYMGVLNGSSSWFFDGTSAATPAFAGIIAILNQYLVASGQASGLSNINPTLYKLAVTTPGVFHDITAGNNIVPCQIGTPNCKTGSFGYSAGPGYDMVTGLGSVNATNLVTLWPAGSHPAPASLVVATATPNPVQQTGPDANGFQWSFAINLSELKGGPTMLTDFTIGGVSYASQIAVFFGSASIPAKGAISAHLGYKTLTVPSTQVFVLTGVDPGGRQWSQQLSVSFLGPAMVPKPVISPGGIGPLYSSSTTIQPGSWVSIYGTNLAVATAVWNGDFPSSLGGTEVTINGKAAYLWFVSPTQINLQAPDDTARGPVPVVVTNSAGSVTATVTLGSAAPSFSLLDGKHVAAIILRSDGSGSFGGGTYDIVGPTGTSLGYKTVAAASGDNVLLFGVGFGPTNPAVPAGGRFSGAAATTSAVPLRIGSKTVVTSFCGLSSAGLYQFNLRIPAGLGTGDVSLQAVSGGMQTPAGVVIALQ